MCFLEIPTSSTFYHFSLVGYVRWLITLPVYHQEREVSFLGGNMIKRRTALSTFTDWALYRFGTGFLSTDSKERRLFWALSAKSTLTDWALFAKKEKISSFKNLLGGSPSQKVGTIGSQESCDAGSFYRLATWSRVTERGYICIALTFDLRPGQHQEAGSKPP